MIALFYARAKLPVCVVTLNSVMCHRIVKIKVLYPILVAIKMSVLL